MATATEVKAPAAPAVRKGPPARVFVLLFLVIAGVGGWFGYRKWSATRPLEWSGTIEARTVEVGSRSGGRVKEVLVREGERVEAGQSLVILEAGDLEAQRLMAAAQLEQATANLDKLKNGPRPEEITQAKARAQTAVAALDEAKHGARPESIRAARARVEAAQVTADKAKLDAERAKSLFTAGAISKAELDVAESNQRSANAQRDVSQEALNELQNGVRREQLTQATTRVDEAQAGAQLVEAGARPEDIRASEAQVKAAKGRVDQLDVALAELTVKAPAAARVESLDLRPGDILAPNAVAAVLLEDSQLYVRVYIPETQLGFVSVGQEVPIYVDSFPDHAFMAEIESVDMKGQYSPRNLQTADERANQVFAARIGLKDGAGQLRAGMAAIARVPRPRSGP